MRTSQFILGTAASVLLVVAVGTSQLRAHEGGLPRDVVDQLGTQLNESFSPDGPFETDLPDHLWIGGDEGSVVFLHLDKPVAEATRVIYTGFGIKGRWCAEDQERIEALAGEGFTHFHRIAEVATAEAGHGGGEPGEPGYWLKHVAVGPAFEMPWGTVASGQVDHQFMPTDAPKCDS